MTATQMLLVGALAWVAIGFAAAYFMARKGFDPFTWWLMAALLGPLVVALMTERLQRRPHPGWAQTVAGGTPGEGPVDVLVGIDGSLESHAALAAVRRLMGDRIGRMTLATVEDFDAPTRVGGEEAYLAELDSTGQVVPGAARVLLVGKPSEALAAHAKEEGYHLLVVGRRGAGLSKRLLGSAAEELARSATVPVLIADR